MFEDLNLLYYKKLLKPLLNSIEKLQNITPSINEDKKSITNHGLFVMANAYYEAALSDSLRYYFECFPKKLNFSNLSFSKEITSFSQSNLSFAKQDVFDDDLIQLEIDKKLSSLFFDKFENYIHNYLSIMGIENEIDISFDIDYLIEIKETRNLLMHNNLIVNTIYLDKVKSIKRANKIGDTLIIDRKYIIESIERMIDNLHKIETSLSTKYNDYKRLRILRTIWSYLFSSPVMPFDDFWETNADTDSIIQLKDSKYESHISNSEKMLLDVWRSHYTGNPKRLENFCIYSLDGRNQKKLLYFLSILDKIDLECH